MSVESASGLEVLALMLFVVLHALENNAAKYALLCRWAELIKQTSL